MDPMTSADLEFEQIEVGRHASFEHRITAEEVDRFAELSGDQSPLHMDDAYAAQTKYGRRLVHGLHVAALISRLCGMYIPGKRGLSLSQSFDYVNPAYIGDVLRVGVTVVQKHPASQTLTLKFEVMSEAGIVLRGNGLSQVRSLS